MSNILTKFNIPLILISFIVVLIALCNATVYAQADIAGFEINQVLGIQKDKHQYYVAGKSTLLRVFLNKETNIKEIEEITDEETGEKTRRTITFVKVLRDDKPVVTLSPKSNAGSTKVVDFHCNTLKDCGNWAAGTYTFEAKVNDVSANITGSYKFVAGSAPRILAVRIKANYGGTNIKSVSGSAWKEMWKFAEMVYPVARDSLKWTASERELDASASSFSLVDASGNVSDGGRKIADKLVKFIPDKCKTSPQNKGCYDYVAGFIKENVGTTEGFIFLGTPAFVVVADNEDALATVAHELGHHYGLGDTYNNDESSSIRCSVNPAPDGFEGLDWDNDDEKFKGCKAGRLPSTLIGKKKETVSAAQISADTHPYNVDGKVALQEMADFMGSGAFQNQIWITRDSYDWLYERLVNKKPDSIKPLMVPLAPQLFLSFSGTLSKTGVVEIEPWKSYTDTAALTDTSGPLMIQAIDGSGNVVASTSFTVRFFMIHPPKKLDKASFSGVVRFPSDTVKFRIVKDGATLKEVAVSGNPPGVSSVSPLAKTTINGPYTITWVTSDADGDTLASTVEYNRDVTDPDSPWMILVDNLYGNSWQEDFSHFPGGDHAKIRVTVSDGVLTAVAESAEFIVPMQKPEVFLDTLTWGNTYAAGSDILLTAEAYDPQDEWLPDDKLKWTSDLSGLLGYGSGLIVKNLSPGKHIITLTATNSAGLAADASASVIVTSNQLPPSSSSSSTSCFIATAAYGSFLHPYVQILREFRDAFLIVNPMGKSFVEWYYRVSPGMADAIRNSETMKAGARMALLPVVGISCFFLTVGAVPTLLMFFLFPAAISFGIRGLYRHKLNHRK